jgi:hypothetical protein
MVECRLRQTTSGVAPLGAGLQFEATERSPFNFVFLGGSVSCGRDVVGIEVIHAYLHSLYFCTPFKLVIVKARWRLPMFSPIAGCPLRGFEHVVVIAGKFHDASRWNG